MLITDLKNCFKVHVNKKDFYFEKNKLYQQLLTSELLGLVSLNELKPLFIMGIPNNIKEFLKLKILLYKESFAIKSFIYKDKECWLDKNTRNSLWNLSNSSLGNVEIVIGDDIITINSLKLKAFLLKLEVYSYKCFVNTHKHLQAIKELKTVEDILNYDYTLGYPNKLKFDEHLDLVTV